MHHMTSADMYLQSNSNVEPIVDKRLPSPLSSYQCAMAQSTTRNLSKTPATGGKRTPAAKATPAQRNKAASEAAKWAKKGVTTARTTNKSKSASDNNLVTPTHPKQVGGQPHAVLHASSAVNNASNMSLSSDPASMEMDIEEDPAAEVVRLKGE